MEKKPARCLWPGDDPQMVEYHDKEWGVPCHNDQLLFEYITLDTFQAGLSWKIILHKREAFRKTFVGFDPSKIARFGARDVRRLLNDKGIIRNRLKIEAAIRNAEAYLAVSREFGSFESYIWQFVGGETILNACKRQSHIRANSEESNAMSRDMKKRGFSFVGTTVCYAFMQGAGLVNDHLVSCFRYHEVAERKK